jgi:hypothetical protein
MAKSGKTTKPGKQGSSRSKPAPRKKAALTERDLRKVSGGQTIGGKDHII